MRVLLVEDERELAAAVKRGLEQHGFVVDLAECQKSAWQASQVEDYGCLILDRRLPDGDGLELCRRLRSAGMTLPVVMLTARDGLDDRVAGLNGGADDYLVKPFELPELVARLHAVLRRSRGVPTNVLTVQDLRLDLDLRLATRGDRTISLTQKEFRLLAYLMRHPGRVSSGDQLLFHVWDDTEDTGGDTLRTHIKNLRRKIDGLGVPKLLHTVHGHGYVLGP